MSSKITPEAGELYLGITEDAEYLRSSISSYYMPDDFHQLLTLPSACHCSQPANEGVRPQSYKELLLNSS